MSTNKKQPLYNAGEIIERFGGIRPMASKIDTPVTTVQGWKKRDVIPAARRATILEAATNNNINIEDLATAEESDVRPASSKPKATKSKTAKKTKAAKKTTKTKTKAETAKVESKKPENEKVESMTVAAEAKASVPSAGISATSNDTACHNESNKSCATNNSEANNNVSTNIWITTGLILLGLALALYFIVPKLKASDSVIEAQSQKLVELEHEIDETRGIQEATQKAVDITSDVKKNDNGFFGASLPENLEEKIDNLQNQTRNISVTVDQLTEKAKKLSEGALEQSAEKLNTQTDKVKAQVKDFEKKIEEKMSALSLPTALPDVTAPTLAFNELVKKINTMKASNTGLQTLSQAAQELTGLITTSDNEEITNNLEKAQKQDGALGETIMGVPKNDLKAAATLIAFSQLRSSLEREESFEQDIELLQNLVGNKSPELSENIKRLSAHANGGVLTTQGLSSALKKTAADIVVSSLKGENVSIKEKAKARFSDLVQVEKDGVSLTGTETQKTLNKAQEALDAGKLEDSIVLLETLEGDASQVAQPVIEQAKGSLLANQTITMLEGQIFSPNKSVETNANDSAAEKQAEDKSTKFDLSKENVFIVPKSDTITVLE